LLLPLTDIAPDLHPVEEEREELLAFCNVSDITKFV
jgi:hypothetical protein